MKKKYLTLSIIFVLTFGIGNATMSAPSNTYTTLPVERQYREAAIVWSDNFDDGNMDDWVTFALPDQPSNFTVIDGVVYSLSEDSINVANHESSVAYGTWSFDIFMGGEQLSGVEFISSVPITTRFSQYGYELVFATPSSSIELVELFPTSDSSSGRMPLDTHPTNPAGWHHVDITRDNTGYFCVYFNSTPVLEAVDTTVTASTGFAFAFGANSGGAFDNVVVSDSVDMDIVAPYFLQEPRDHVITVGDDFNYKLNATDSSGAPIWEINDTVRFEVNGPGWVTNIIDLEAGVYGLEVTASDRGVYDRSVTFTVTVEEATTSFDPTLLVVGGGIAVFVIIVLVIFMKKRS